MSDPVMTRLELKLESGLSALALAKLEKRLGLRDHGRRRRLFDLRSSQRLLRSAAQLKRRKA